MSFPAKIAILVIALLGLIGAELVGDGGSGPGGKGNRNRGIINVPWACPRLPSARSATAAGAMKSEDFPYVYKIAESGGPLTVKLPTNLRGATAILHGDNVVVSLGRVSDALTVSGLDAVEIMRVSGRTFRIGTDEPRKLVAALRATISSPPERR